MKPEEALKIIGDWISEQTEARKYFKGEIYELSEALIVLKGLIEKQIPKKLEIDGEFDLLCAGCGSVLDFKGYDGDYCPYCGQKINWEETP